MADTSSRKVRYAEISPRSTSDRSTSLGSNEKIAGGKSWRAPVVILTALLVGFGMALMHHLMNVHLDGKPVANVRVSQPWISRFSTTFAFLVKMAFTISVGVAFIQRQWLMFHRQTFKIADVDAMTSVLGNPLGFLSSRIWFRHPILVLTALMSWAIPFAAVVTPGSLSVVPVQRTAITALQVPQPLYNGTNYGYTQSGGPGFEITTASNLYKLAYATASSAQPVSLPSAYQNQTYQLQFNGPAVKCGMANESVVQNISSLFAEGGYYGNIVSFVSWVAGDEQAYNTSISGSWGQFQTLDAVSTDAARIFVMSNTGSWSISVSGMDNFQTTDPVTQVNVTECLLFNATYNVDFTFRYPQQTRNISISSWLNPVPAPGPATNLTSYDENGATTDAVNSYSAMMNAYGKLLVGADEHSHYSIDNTFYTSWNIMNIDWSRSEAVQAGLEQLFQNYTLSLLSDSGLIKNSTEADFIPVTVEAWPVTYVYNRFELLLAYGLSFLSTCICAVVGLHAFLANHDSYQNLFSTYLRVTNDPDLRALVDPSDSGADPLPKYLAQVRIGMTREAEGESKI